MEVFLFISYLLLFSWCILHTRFFRNSGLSRFQLVALFLLKVGIGVAYGWINWYSGPGPGKTDTWVLYAQSLKETQTLLTSPVRYISSFFYNPYTNSFGSLFASSSSYWNNLKDNTFIRIESVFNCFSFGSYFVNIIFYNFLVYFGVIALYRVMREHLGGNRLLLIVTCLLVPSFLYWTSGLHKDGLTFLTLSTVIYIIYFRKTRSRPLKSYLLLLAALLLLFALRNHVLLVFLPALAAWMLAQRFPLQRVWLFAGIYSLGFLFFFTAKYLHPSLDFPAIVAGKQDAFLRHIGGTSTVQVQRLRPDITGFVQQLPQAAGIVLFRPFVLDIKKAIVVPAFLEVMLIWTGVLLLLFFPKRKPMYRPFSLFLVAFTVSMVLMIGYSVNNLGAIVRYRSILFPLIVPPVIMGICWGRVLRKINIKIN
ncbi:hypothetical protein [Niabella drilacis]|uniref:Dolichyl-phosphate-mannose-protein mannosyltransferase n=1 Tax=Niabella drilacis (strain DSM 25811 / CCM 8410 / CCUG 62505 / LMG 26954 / E90) TaxID=1285928 RepID=A0A1G6I789_NIADE|nr:hypothetical protein [Niabella drilacis]SDC02233.1 hypothetical protein SAMN04487894_101117 [Niabella drilacis]